MKAYYKKVKYEIGKGFFTPNKQVVSWEEVKILGEKILSNHTPYARILYLVENKDGNIYEAYESEIFKLKK
jgi:hypothetical protein